MSGRWEFPAGSGLALLRAAGAAPPRGGRGALLDRDGTLNEGVADPETGLAESPLAAPDVRLLPHVADSLGRLETAGYALVCVTNQPAAAKGKTTVEELLAVHERVLALLAADGLTIALSLLCLHHPEGVVAGLAGACECRKPAPGMLRRAAAMLALDLARSWMIGDTDGDVLAGNAAGCGTALLEYPPSEHKRTGIGEPQIRADGLAGAVELILDRDSA
ncbi:MAG TPA: HAD-IIIA family hydrolase [Solirubrobacteraceae bacterium]|nr:HAD-IIIA family hydrolase [Solirubrobacteraceae bacterium]